MPGPMQAHQFYGLVARQEYDRRLPSTLGAGCCQLCGKPRGQCPGDQTCLEYTVEEWAELWRDDQR